MKTLILYATKHGATEKIAELIAEELPGSELFNIRKSPAPSLGQYDTVILGSPLTAGRIRKEIREFSKKNESVLLGKKLGLFVSGLSDTGDEQYFETNFPPALAAGAAAKAFLGGIYDPAKCNAFERMVIKAASKLTVYTSVINRDRISLFARKLSQ
ncbi:flavodoxin domain-containing protein [Breznakiella homolactica]|uniref:Flavodoxin-like domain-containing protein n=1 Tax=Breznakiella homolactica TaxID=2798577 RepID=A0A7T7XL92_9SPIR|nr:flavodoxin domain-containing protein [Breznakiella homolactica]QQO08469.1 flavodoxin domain-containing protein [Breznakiella homolactica]